LSDNKALAAWSANPFFVLEVSTDASRTEVERAGQRLLALLSINTKSASQYTTPFGTFTRDADSIRQALATLRDPKQRIVCELLADVKQVNDELKQHYAKQSPVWEDAESALGWLRNV
jgi:hypothetical protein